MRSVAEWVALGCGLLGKALKIRDLESQMGQIGPYHNRAAGVVLADLDFFVAFGGLKKDQLGTASALTSTNFLQAKDITVKGDRFFEVLNAIASVEESGDHCLKDET